MKNLYSRSEMQKLNIDLLKEHGVSVEAIAQIAYQQQARYNSDIKMSDCVESVFKILSLRDVFHILQLSAEIDRLAKENLLREPIRSIIYDDLGVFGVDEVLGLNVAGLYGVIGETNFGDIDINKPGIVKELDIRGKSEGECCTFLDDIVGAIAASASTRVAQIYTEEVAKSKDDCDDNITIFDFEDL